MKKIIALGLVCILIFTMAGCALDFYTLTVAEADRELLDMPPVRICRAGQQVVIKTHILYDADMECFVNGKSIGKQTAVQTGGRYTHWEYYFEMPAENVTVTFEITGGV